jgi:hypothetical protein
MAREALEWMACRRPGAAVHPPPPLHPLPECAALANITKAAHMYRDSSTDHQLDLRSYDERGNTAGPRRSSMIDVCTAFRRLVLNGMCRDLRSVMLDLDDAAIPVFAQCIKYALMPSLSTLHLYFHKDTSEESIGTALRNVADGCPPDMYLYLEGPVPEAAVVGTLPTVENVYINDVQVRPESDPQEFPVAKRRRGWW